MLLLEFRHESLVEFPPDEGWRVDGEPVDRLIFVRVRRDFPGGNPRVIKEHDVAGFARIIGGLAHRAKDESGHGEAGFFAHFAARGLLGVFAVVVEPGGEHPGSLIRFSTSLHQEHLLPSRNNRGNRDGHARIVRPLARVTVRALVPFLFPRTEAIATERAVPKYWWQ